MREIYNSNCVLWSKTRVLAQDHGFEMSNLCPMQEVCRGETCIFLEPIKQTADNLEKFHDRLDKHQVKVRLAELRQEINRIGAEQKIKTEAKESTESQSENISHP